MSEDVKKEDMVEEGELVELETPEEEAGTEENVEVEEEATAAPSEEPEEELEEYSERVQKRIKNLTRRLREAERASESAYAYANQVQAENKKLQTSSVNSNKSYLSEAESRLDAQKKQATEALKTAMQDQDYDKVAKVQDIMAKIAVEESKVVSAKTALEQPIPEQNVSQENYVQQQPVPDEKALNWAAKNEWFGQNEEMTMEAGEIHRTLVLDEGFDPKSDEYYTEVDKRIRARFPGEFGDKANTKKPTQKVASAGRADTSAKPSKKQVRLSPSEVAMARKLNVPLSEYAKFVKR